MQTISSIAWILVLTANLNVLAEKPNLDLHVSDQIARLKSLGYDASKLDDHTQLRVFLYTWLGIERGEGGRCPSTKTPTCTNTNFGSCYRQYVHHIGPGQTLERCFQAMGCSFITPDCKELNNKCINFVREDSIGCCSGWIQIMGICTRIGWYNGADGNGVKNTINSIRQVIQV